MWRQNISIILLNRETEHQNYDSLLWLYNLNRNLKQGISVCRQGLCISPQQFVTLGG